MKAALRKLMMVVLVCLLAATSAHGQGYGVGTPLEAKEMVIKAVAFAKANGEEAALKEFSNPNGRFQWRDLYVFAYDPKGVVIAHPNPKLIGRNLYNEPDTQGKFFRRDIIDIANSRGSGWVDYKYLEPMTKQEEFKITFFQKVGNLIICCGAYLP